ncbi:MAG TPA: nucleotidyl transferase AbiEii/AbiGii toxin family protein [Planctomycetota bacterium]|nr:nucleotidyl transferase AbiEii/AbiGii toxin family protein [Planctomycetota bacterium]
MPRTRLSAFQHELLDAFFERSGDFFLTGGGALAGFHLGHRTTEDLDLFTTIDVLDAGVDALRGAASSLGAGLESLRTSPTLRRFLVRRGNETVLVDLVFEPVPQARAEKPRRGKIRIDPPEEILANKLCALLSRSELRDLVDVLELERAGFPVDSALPWAMKKDSGLTPAQLAWVLSQIHIGDDARIPGTRSPEEVREYLADLRTRLAGLSMPR